MRHHGLALAVLLALAVVLPARAQAPGPQGAEQGKYREQRWLIPTDDGSGRMMHTVMFRPAGETPRRLVVINHGAPTAGPATAPQPRFAEASAWFVDHGYVVVVPQRRGYGDTGGRQNEAFGHCDNADFIGAGREGARDIAATVAFVRQHPFVQSDGSVIVGHSAGGWASLAYASLNPPGVAAMVNVAGGRGGRRDNQPNYNCSPDKLVQGAGTYGRTARVPTLWLYTANDSFFDAGLSRRMADAYRNAGGSATYLLLPAFGQDGHALFVARGSMPVWSPHVRPFLDRSP